MVREPAARMVRGGPGRVAGVVDRELIAHVDPRMIQTADAIRARGHQLRRDVVDAMPGGVEIAGQIVGGIPPHGVGPGGEGRLAHQIPHAAAIGRIDDQRHVARRIERESHGDRPMEGGGRQRPPRIGRFQRRIAQRMQGEQFAEPDPVAVLGLAHEMRVAFLGDLRDPQADRPRGQGLPQVEPVDAQPAGILVLESCPVFDGPPVGLGGLARRAIGGALNVCTSAAAKPAHRAPRARIATGCGQASSTSTGCCGETGCGLPSGPLSHAPHMPLLVSSLIRATASPLASLAAVAAGARLTIRSAST